ncbi:MAG TPA: DUF2304 domain-containing protein [Acidimicrobiia bacterium]|nr:DUF2304 domain-containing protein [Acidimicrobiia bacterium]
MTTRIHVLAILLAIAALLLTARLVRRGGLRSKYALLWITSAALLLPLSLFPGLLDWYAHLIGIHYPPTALALTAMAVLFVVAFNFSWELSRTEDRVRRLAEEVALLLDASRLHDPS